MRVVKNDSGFLNHKQNYGLGILMVFERYLIMLFDFQGDGCYPHYPGPQWGSSLPPCLSGTLLHAVQECPQSSRHHYCKLCLSTEQNDLLSTASQHDTKLYKYIINIKNNFVYNVGLNLINDVPVLCGFRNTVELCINFCSTVIK